MASILSKLFMGSLALGLLGCQAAPEPNQNAEPEIIRLLNAQQEAWNRGDLSGFMDAYHQGEDLSFVTSKGLLLGHKELEARYKSSYPNTGRMGTLSFEILKFDALGAGHAMLIGKWALSREGDHPEGYFTLIWEKTKDGWKIISDHTS